MRRPLGTEPPRALRTQTKGDNLSAARAVDPTPSAPNHLNKKESEP